MKELIYFMGRSVCHQFPERSFFIQNEQMPLCARCTGIYMGMFLGFIYLFLAKRWKGNKPPTLSILILIVISWVPMMVDGVTSYLDLRESNNMTRLITGLLFGVFMPIFIVLLKNYKIKATNNIPIIKDYKDLLIMVCILIISASVIIMQSTVVWWIWSSITVFTILYVYTQVIYIVVKQMFSSIKKITAYSLALTFALLLMSGLALVNQILLGKYR